VSGVSFTFRRVFKSDRTLLFRTGELAFDDINNETGSLGEYIQDDTITKGLYTTFIFIENKEQKNQFLLRLLRYKEVPLDSFIQDVRNTDADDIILHAIEANLQPETRVIYLSRIGIQEDFKRERIGTLIARFFDFLIQREKKNTIIYCKVLKSLDTFLSSPYITLGVGVEAKWGEYVLKYRYFYQPV